MITYKIHKFPNFEKYHRNFFSILIDNLNKEKLISKCLDEIIITDNISEDIEDYCLKFNLPIQRITVGREFVAVSKIIDFDNCKKIFFNAESININNEYSTQIFYEQVISVYSFETISKITNTPIQYEVGDSLEEIIKILFTKWSASVLGARICKSLTKDKKVLFNDVKVFVNHFKRNIKGLHIEYQKNQNNQIFISNFIHELDYFIERSIILKSDEGSFEQLQEFKSDFPLLLQEIDLQTSNLLDDKVLSFLEINSSIDNILKLCNVKIHSYSQTGLHILESPKKLFKTNLIDTEQRIVAFIDILGFSNIIKEYDSDESSNILNQLHEALENAIKTSIDTFANPKIKSEIFEHIDYRMFSDCICLSLPFIDYGNDFHLQFNSLSTIIKAYQLSMMNTGFYVRGGVAIGSFFSDRNMIFSGGLVKAHYIEGKAINPIVVVDNAIIDRLKIDYKQHSKGLRLDGSLIYSVESPELVFINPFEQLDNSNIAITNLQSLISELANGENPDDDPLGKLSSTIFSLANTSAKPIFELAKNYLTPSNIKKSKEEILRILQLKIDDVEYEIKNAKSNNKTPKTYFVAQESILSKLIFLREIINWSIDSESNSKFKILNLIDSK